MPLYQIDLYQHNTYYHITIIAILSSKLYVYSLFLVVFTIDGGAVATGRHLAPKCSPYHQEITSLNHDYTIAIPREQIWPCCLDVSCQSVQH